MQNSVVKRFGILTSGGDAPGLNAAIRGVARAAIEEYGMEVIGIEDGYRGLIEGKCRKLTQKNLSGILSRGGTILGTSREKPFKHPEPDPETGRTPVESIKHNYEKWGLDALVVLGGNGTNTTASLLAEAGLNVIGLPKTIDNDLPLTDTTFGFNTAVSVATEAIDRLHTTAHSHSRVMVIEVMGHKAGWLGLYAGTAGGGDVILIPEIPYSIEPIAEHIKARAAAGHPFSIVVVAEGARSVKEAGMDKKELKKSRADMPYSIAYRVAKEIEKATDIESRVTVLGYLQRGGTPVPYDRVIATQVGTKAARMLAEGDFGKMVAIQNGIPVGVPLADIAGKIKKVPLDHPLLTAARQVGTCFGD